MNDYIFGNFVCKLREEQGMTQAELAARLGITAAAVSKWENGESKPRVDMLYRLSELLGVSVEELLAGHRTDGDSLDADAVRRVREQYEYLRRTESHSSASVKIRRICACLVDGMLFWLVAFLLIAAILLMQQFGIIGGAVSVFGVVIAILSWPALMMLRDLIGVGRSLGKRIFGLIVLDRRTGGRARPWQLLVRCLFLMFQEPDMIIMLIRGQSIGDSAARTLVVSKREAEANYSMSAEDINSYGAESRTHRKKGRRVAAIVCTGVGAFIFICVFSILVVVISLESVKSSPEYKVAYEYLIESDAFASLDETDASLRAYEISTSLLTPEGTVVHGMAPKTNARFTFDVGPYSAVVICHKRDDGSWYACDICTAFD